MENIFIDTSGYKREGYKGEYYQNSFRFGKKGYDTYFDARTRSDWSTQTPEKDTVEDDSKKAFHTFEKSFLPCLNKGEELIKYTAYGSCMCRRPISSWFSCLYNTCRNSGFIWFTRYCKLIWEIRIPVFRTENTRICRCHYIANAWGVCEKMQQIVASCPQRATVTQSSVHSATQILSMTTSLFSNPTLSSSFSLKKDDVEQEIRG